MSALCLILLSAALGADTQQKVNPVQKVTELLSNLQRQIMDEGKEEAAEYDKFACFCKEQVDEKTYNINKAVERELVLEGLIESKEGTKEGLDEDIGEANIDIGNLEGTMEESLESRNRALGRYQTLNRQLETAITALEDAIDALQASKTGMVDMHEQKSVLTQYAAVIKNSLYLAEEKHLVKHEKVLSLLGNAPHAYGYHSNEIVATLESLLKDFKGQNVKGDEEERAAVQAYEMERGARENEVDALQHEVDQKSAESSKLGDEISDHTNEKTDTENDRLADTSFRTELTSKCETKATDWDQRSRKRSGELEAISKAMEQLKGDVTEMYPATGINLATKTQKVSTTTAESEQEPLGDEEGDVSFLQTSHDRAARRKITGYLEEAAKRLHSQSLTTVLLKIRQTPGPFSKIKQMIHDMVSRLEKEAGDETDQKTWCDGELSTSKFNRDTAQANIEELNAKKAENLAAIDQLKEDIQQLADEISALAKALNEDTILRETEKENNNRTVTDATAGYAAVTRAINFLNGFYNPTAVAQNPVHQGFLQAPGYQVFKAANEDASGLTVDDRAPDTFSGNYGGKAKESHGIIGMLEVIQSDFDRTIRDTATAEFNANRDFNTYQRETNRDIRQKTVLKRNQETRQSNREADVVQNDDDLTDENQDLTNALEYLETLQPVCVETGMDWKERAARRKDEVEALKQALKIFQNTDFGFMQKK